MNPCPNRESNEAQCTCGSANCPRHGVCCECLRYHLQNGGTPACMK